MIAAFSRTRLWPEMNAVLPTASAESAGSDNAVGKVWPTL